MISRKIDVKSMDELIKLFGPFDENIKAICQAFDVRVVVDNGQSSLMGEESNVETALAVIKKLRSIIYNGDNVDIGRVNYICDCAKSDKLDEVDQLLKVNPYLRPLYDALQEMLGQETFAKMTERGTIEIAPLAYMRGRTLSNAYIILDEAQNTTREQIKMFLTRLGEGSKMIVTGDLTQVDLPKGTTSGLRHAVRILRDIDDIGIIKLSEKDVVRHPLVQQIVKAYEENGNAD